MVGLSAQVAICAELCARTNSGHAVGAGPGVIDWTSSSDTDAYTVALNEAHFRDLVLATTTPPVTHQTQPAPGVAGAGAPQLSEAASLLMMGFPSRTVAETITVPAANAGKQQANAGNGKEAGKQQTTSTRTLPALSLCACHNSPIREGYGCTRCGTRVCRLPIECPACGLTLVLSTHLARSYHHLFPLRNWVEVSWAEAEEAVAGRQTIADPSAPGGRRRIPRQTACFACQVPFNKIPSEFKRGGGGTADGEQDKDKGKGKEKQHDGKRANKHQNEKQQQQPKPQQPQLAKGLSESGRYACPVCGSHFCIDCDVFAHDVIHNCPGCQADTRAHARAAALLAQQLMESGTDTGAMELDSQPPAGRENGGGGIGVNGRGSQMELD